MIENVNLPEDVKKEVIMSKLDSCIAQLDGIYLAYHVNKEDYLDLRDLLVEIEKEVKGY
jgi:hypothetical protein